MLLHCAATRPNFLNVFSNPVACFDDILENGTYNFLTFFVFHRLFSSNLVSTSLNRVHNRYLGDSMIWWTLQGVAGGVHITSQRLKEHLQEDT